jgi:uncharacterized protein YijF (DUF1287 family)
MENVYAFHRAPDVAALKPACGDEFRYAVRSDQIDLDLAVAKDMDMRRLVIIDKDHDAKSV